MAQLNDQEILAEAPNFTPLEPVESIDTPHLSPTENEALLACVNKIRAGTHSFRVRVTNRKVTKGKKRIAGQDYAPEPGLTMDCHEGVLYAAPTNKKGEVYLRMLDENRRNAEGEPGFTSLSLKGLRSFRKQGDEPGRKEFVAGLLDAKAAELEAVIDALRQRAFVLRQ